MGDILFATAVLTENTLIPKDLYKIYFIGNLFFEMGTHILRCLWGAIFIERAIATAFSGVYEHGHFYWLSFALPMIFGSVAAGIVSSRFICKLVKNRAPSIYVVVFLN